jgi:hypothetical protein
VGGGEWRRSREVDGGGVIDKGVKGEWRGVEGGVGQWSSGGEAGGVGGRGV